MSFKESSLQLGKETRKVKDLAFVKHGEVGSTDKKGVTTVVAGEYTFFVTKNSLAHRFKAKGSRTAKPRKTVKTFAELDKLSESFIPEEKEEDLTPAVAEVAVTKDEPKDKTKNDSADGTTEETTKMAKLNVDGKQLEIPAAAEAALKDLGVTGDIIELSEFDDAILKASGKNLEVLNEFEEQFQDLGAPESAPAGAPAGGLQGNPMAANVFNTGGDEPEPRRVEKSPEEREQDRRDLEARRKKEEEEKKQNIGRIEELRQKQSQIENGQEAVQALKDLLLIKGNLPLFRTLVPSDTRLRAVVRDTVPAAKRVYHPSLQGDPAYTETGKDIPQKESAAEYEVDLRESNPSQPTGYFVYVPESLMSFVPSQLTYSSERENILRAKESENTNLVIKYYPKNELVNLLLILEADLVLYDKNLNEYLETSPRIMRNVRIDTATQTPVFSLRAVDHQGNRTKLSIRSFIPMQTHNTARKSELNLQLLSDALFKATLTNVPNGGTAPKFTMLLPDSLAKFTQNADGTFVYNQFKDVESVPAYDSTKSEALMRDMPLPFVDMSKPTSPSAVARPVFVRTKHSNPGYNPSYQPLVDQVGDQINKTRRQTNKSILSSHTQEIARLEAVTQIMSGEQLTIK